MRSTENSKRVIRFGVLPVRINPVIQVRHSNLTYVFDYGMAVFLVLNYVYYFVSGMPIFARLRLIPLLVCAAIGVYQFYNKERNPEVLLFAILFVLNWMMVSLIKSGEWTYSYGFFKYTLCYLCIALGLISVKHSVFPYKFCFYVIHFYILYQFVFLHRYVGTIIKTETSYNFISVYCLFYLVLYIIVLTQNDMRPSLFDFLLYFLVCLMGRGRGTIIVGFAALAFYLAVMFIRQKNIYKKVLLSAVFLVSLLLFYKYGGMYIEMQGYLEKFERLRFSSNGRFEIWSQYLQSCLKSPIDFLLGANPDFMGADGNLHNEFFQVWASFGFVFLILFVVMCFCLPLYLIRRKYYYLLICFALLIIRGFTDKVFFYGNCEVCLFYLLFFYLTDRRKMRRRVGRPLSRNENSIST